MTIRRCEQGHFYDEDEYDTCPYCDGLPIQDGGKSPPKRRLSYPHNVFSRRPAAVYAGPPLQEPAPKPVPAPSKKRFPTAAIVTIAVAGTVLLASLLFFFLS